MSKEISLRQKKKAKIKLNVLNSMMEMLEECSFEEINVRDLCERATISRVTFYSYFPKKEDLLGYFVAVMSFQLVVDQLIEPKRGKKALVWLFEEIVKTPQILILTIMRFLAVGEYEDIDQELSDAEKTLIHPGRYDVVDVKQLGMDEIFRKHIAEGVADGELDPRIDLAETAIMLNSILFGTALSAHMYGIEDALSLYQKHLDMLYRGSKNMILKQHDNDI